MNTAHLFTALHQVHANLDNLGASITVNTGLSGFCPTGTAPQTKTLQQALLNMMENSSNTDTEALRARYGTALIESTCTSVGRWRGCPKPRHRLFLRQPAQRGDPLWTLRTSTGQRLREASVGSSLSSMTSCAMNRTSPWEPQTR